MARQLNGAEIADFVKERQAKAVRGLKQQWHVQPKLAIIRTNPDPVVDSYMKIKQSYGADVGVEVEVHDIPQTEALETIQNLNADPAVHGIIVQIPLPDVSQTDEILNSVVSEKDVDGLGERSSFDAPTPVAIYWLLNGYDVELVGKRIVIVGHGRLVGKPLQKLLEAAGLSPIVVDKHTENLSEKIAQAEILVSATGVPGLITSDMVAHNVVVVDAGVATDSNGLIGDVDQSVRERSDVMITPIKGGVGPLTVAALFENVITAARRTAQN